MSAMCFKNQLKGMVVILRLVNSIKYVIIYFKIQGYKEADYCFYIRFYTSKNTLQSNSSWNSSISSNGTWASTLSFGAT
jgi:hypothetical protein